MSGEAFRMRIELARLMQRHGMTPAPFTPVAPRAAVDHDISIEGLAAPATIDRERMKFGAHCWMPFRKDIPLLLRHQKDRPAGRIQEIRSTDAGLFVRATITDPEAGRHSYFSVAATVHGYSMRLVDDPQRAHALVTCASVDEVSIVSDPANPDAIIKPTPVVGLFYDTAIKGISVMQQMVQLLQQTCADQRRRSQHVITDRRAPRVAPKPAAPHHAVRRPTEFSRLVQEMNR
jgi:hypothetical protein